MPKGKNKHFTVQSSDDNSDDGDSSCSGLKVKEKLNKIFISAIDTKSKAKASALQWKQTDEGNSDASTESEIEYKGNLKTSRYLENTSTKKAKIKKRKREEASSDCDSSGKDTVSSTVTNTAKSRKKLQRKEKDKIFDSHDSHEPEVFPSKTINKHKNKTHKQVENASESDSENQFTSGNNIEHVSFLDIKRELLSDYGDLGSEAEVEDRNNNSASVNNSINISGIKRELQSQCSSDSEVESDASTTKSLPKRATTDNSSVTILQDIRFIPKSQTVHERLKDHFGDLQRKEITAKFELSDSEEVSILRMPRNANLQLKNVEINPENRCKINVGEKYVMTPTTNAPDPNYIVSTNCRVIKFKNNIKMEKYIKSKSEPNILIPEKKSVPLPENLKKRHPLFGSDFQQKIRLSDDVEKKLDDAIANLLKREKRAKKKKNKQHKHEEKEESDFQEIFNLFNPHSFVANDTIKKEASDDSAFGSSSSTDKLMGKKRQKAHSSERQIKQELELPVDDNFNQPTVKSSKKKKSKTPSEQAWPDVSSIKAEIQDADAVDSNKSPVLSKADKKRLSIINSTLMADIVKTPKFNSEVSSIASDASTSGTKPKKSKKSKKSKDDVLVKKEMLISELLNDVTMEMKVPKKIKREF